MEERLIAPCGINCAVCVRYLARKKDINTKGFHQTYCPGCVPRGDNCTFMKKSCDLVGKGLVRFCHECDSFPCKRLKALDKRYRTKYRMSPLENLNTIKEHGVDLLLEREALKWICPQCGESICCHNGLCMNCDLDKLKENKKYRWAEE